MRRYNIGFDIDGVVCDTLPTAFKVLKKMYPDKVKDDNAEGNWEDAYNLTEKQVLDCFIECGKIGMFRDLPLYNDCKRILHRLKRYYNIYFVTYRNYIPNAKEDTLYWLDSNRIPYYRLVMTKNKFKVAEKEDFKFFLDDSPMFVNRMAKTIVPTFLFRRPWNKHDETDPLVKIISSWKDVENMLLF